MKFSCIQSLYFFTVLLVSFNEMEGQKDYYTAAVFEIAQYQNPSSSKSEVIKKNLEKYDLAAEVSSAHGVDIIVYSEKGLFPHFNGSTIWALDYAEDVPDPTRESTNPCDQHHNFPNSPILRNLSCLAQKHKMYVVADLIDVKECEVETACDDYNEDYCRESEEYCPENGKFSFNALVVFNRNGTLVSKYYKRHIFFTEIGLIPTKNTKNLYFETDFGNFVTDICFDLLEIPTIYNNTHPPYVTALSYPTWWFDSTPLMYFATPFQQSLSFASKLNILAANTHLPGTGSVGSGIFSAVKGALVYTHNPDGKSKLLISNVPKSATEIPKDISFNTKFYYIHDGNVTELNGEEPRDFKRECSYSVFGDPNRSLMNYGCYENPVHQYTFIKLNETKGNINICSNKFCCRLKYEAQSMKETFYFGVSGNKQKYIDSYLFGTQACFLARCEPLEGKPCRNFLLKSDTIFETVHIEGRFDTKHVYPVVINSEIRLTDKTEWSFDGKSKIQYQNMKRKPLLFIGLNGRLYDQDETLIY